MKKRYFVAFTALLASCAQEEPTTNNISYNEATIVATVADFKAENGSRTTLTPTSGGSGVRVEHG